MQIQDFSIEVLFLLAFQIDPGIYVYCDTTSIEMSTRIAYIRISKVIESGQVHGEVVAEPIVVVGHHVDEVQVLAPIC